MKIIITFLTIILFLNCSGQTKSKKETVYKIILKTKTVPGDIDTIITSILPEPIRAIAAFYSAMGGTMCDGKYCQLTTALGLGEQGSNKHKDLIKKYFPNDKVAEAVLKQDCYLRPSGASTFSDFQFLTITEIGDTIKVDYNLMFYNHGKGEWTSGPDTYKHNGNTFTKIKRNLWKFADK